MVQPDILKGITSIKRSWLARFWKAWDERSLRSLNDLSWVRSQMAIVFPLLEPCFQAGVYNMYIILPSGVFVRDL